MDLDLVLTLECMREETCEKGAKFLIFGLNEGQQEKMGALQKRFEITQMGKEPIIAVIERR